MKNQRMKKKGSNISPRGAIKAAAALKQKLLKQKMIAQNASKVKSKAMPKRVTRKHKKILKVKQISSDYTDKETTEEEEEDEDSAFTEKDISNDYEDSRISEATSSQESQINQSESYIQESNNEEEEEPDESTEEEGEDDEDNDENIEMYDDNEDEDDEEQDDQLVTSDGNQQSSLIEESQEQLSQNKSKQESDQEEEDQSEEGDNSQEEDQQTQSAQCSDDQNQSEQDGQESNNEESGTERDENGRKKIYRRKAVEILKEYKCKAKKCGKLYGSYQALYTHLKVKHIDLGLEKLQKLAEKERKRILKLEEQRMQQKVSDENSNDNDSNQQQNGEDSHKVDNESEINEGSQQEQEEDVDQDNNEKEEYSDDDDVEETQEESNEDNSKGSIESNNQKDNKNSKKGKDGKKTKKNEVLSRKNEKKINNGKKYEKISKQFGTIKRIKEKSSKQTVKQEEDANEIEIEDDEKQQRVKSKLPKGKQSEIGNSKKVKEIYVEKYMHLIKPGLVNKNQIKKLMKNKQLQQEEEEDEMEQEKQTIPISTKKQKEILKLNQKLNSASKLNGVGKKDEVNQSKQKEIVSQNIKQEEQVEVEQRKGPGRPKKKKIITAIRRTYGSVEQMIQKSINKQLALAEIKKQQRNLKLQKIDKKKINELNVFQPSYLFDLVKEIQLSSIDLDEEDRSSIIVEDFNNIIFKNAENTENSLPNANTAVKQPKGKKKGNKNLESERTRDYLDDYPDLDEKNSFLLEPLKKQLQYVKSLDKELGNEDIQGIGMRLAYVLKFVSQYVSQAFYQEFVYFMGYLLRVLSIKKAVQYQDVLQDFLSIYEYIMNSIHYCGFIHCFPIFSKFTDISQVYNFPKNLILSVLKVVFKSNNAYSQNLQQQYYYYNQALPSQL